MGLLRAGSATSVERELGEPIEPLVDACRVVDERGWGPARFEPSVVDLLVERFTFAIRASVHRMARSYASVKRRILDDASTAGQASLDPAKVEPDVDQLGPTGPLDERVGWALTSGIVRFDAGVTPASAGLGDDGAGDARAGQTGAAARDPSAVAQRIDIVADLLDAIARDAVAFGLADDLAPVMDAIAARRAACAASPEEANRWAEHTAQQLSLVGAARDGLGAMGEGWCDRDSGQWPSGLPPRGSPRPPRRVASTCPRSGRGRWGWLGR
jgi:hypothetical protein